MIDFPCAKVNLGLNVVSKREDGYHNLETVFCPINLCDKIEITEISEKNGNDDRCILNTYGIAIDGNRQDNLVIKAYQTVKKLYPEIPPISISLTKNIPSQAGMGGGSSDCAYTIKMLNKMFNLGMSITEMQEVAAKLGADCAFFISPTPSYATGIGEKLSPIKLDLDRYYFAIVKPPVKISTKEAFANILPHKPTTCCKDIVKRPINQWKDELINDFEQSISSQHQEIISIKENLYSMGALYASMSGSGSAVFGIFDETPKNIQQIFKGYFTSITTIKNDTENG